MNKTKKVISILIILLVIICFALFLILNNFKEDEPIDANVVITQYKEGSPYKIQTITLDNKEDIKQISKFVKRLKKLPISSTPKLALLQEININYNDNIIIEIQLSEKDFCYYTDKSNNISGLSSMPKGLYEWLLEKI